MNQNKDDGEFERLHSKLVNTAKDADNRFFQYYRMTFEEFEHLHALLEPKLYRQRTN